MLYYEVVMNFIHVKYAIPKGCCVCVCVCVCVFYVCACVCVCVCVCACSVSVCVYVCVSSILSESKFDHNIIIIGSGQPTQMRTHCKLWSGLIGLLKHDHDHET